MNDKENINRGQKNLSTDTSLVDQPKDSTRFVLNGVNETHQGDRKFISNEESNEECYQLSVGYIPLGKVYMNDNKQVILSVANDESMSEIGIVDNNCNYTTIVNADLGFKVTEQIDVTYRLRRGCEDTIYFTTPIPMIFNFSKLDDFKDSLGAWDSDKFKLFQRFSDDPIFETITVEESGNLKPGSYNASIQYLDNDLNPTEWIVSSSVIKIYNDNLSKKYSTIRGSTGKLTDYQKFGDTNKSIKFTFSNLDTDYSFYRVAIIAANNGTGQINEVSYSQEISTEIPVFNYTGISSVQTQGTRLEILQFAFIIEQANHIEQIDNKLLLGDTKGKQINYCKLQKYASRIKADLTTKEIILNSISDSNPKSPTVSFEGTGYMPGEIYSFGIVYKFDDGDISPTFHIPGRAAGYYSLMSSDNACVDTFYTDNSSCDDYWGKDSEGIDLLSTNVRHHRFPLRSEVNKPLFTEEPATEPVGLNQLLLNISGVINAGYTNDTIEYTVEYQINGNISFYESTINVDTYDNVNGLSITITTSSNTVIVNNIYENGVAVATPSATTDLTYTTSIGASSLNVDDKVFKSEIFGITFSGISSPPSEILGGREIVGYYIVRNERDDDNKTILDTGVITPLLEEPYFVSHGHIMPNLADTSRIKEDVFALIHPEHRFGGKEYTQTTDLIKEGEYRLLASPAISSVITQDVMAGTSYDSEIAKKREKDYDGFSLHTVTRDNEVQYVRVEGVIADATTMDNVFYLDTLNSKVVTDINSDRKEIFNVSGDNKIGIIQLNQALDKEEVNGKLPYVIMKRTLSNPYGNFRVLEYYKETNNRVAFIKDGMGNVIAGDEISVFNGDTYVTPMRYHSSLFYDIRLRKRASKKGIFNIILGALAIIAGILVTVGTLGGGAAVGIALIGFGVSQAATGLQKNQIAKVYSELYDAGLRDAVDDDDTNAYFGPNPPDDEVQWLGDTVTNLWFESTVNMGLRQGATQNIPDFLDSPAVKAVQGNVGTSTITIFGNTYTIVNSSTTPENELDTYLLEKLTILDSDNENGRLYQGFSNAEIYELNPDYRRINKEKIFFHLGIEYDCCSECVEEFPGRIHHSEQAFQEELTDNYRVFLPNNYKDIEGQKGRITNLYRLSDNIFVHTEEALWHLPRTYQERVTSDIVSFIGTGSYFEIPPKKVVDSDDSSAGTTHKWGAIKTKHGILFPNQVERKWYLFTGNDLKAITDQDNSSWFKNNMGSLVAKQYYNTNQRPYPFINNPSHKFGEGFISTYDTKKERFIVTKKDYSLTDDLLNMTDYELCVNGDVITVFENFQATIDTYATNGYDYVGIENCELKFVKTEYIAGTEERTIITSVSNTADIHVFYDTSGSFGNSSGLCLQSIKDAVASWQISFAASNPDWTGSVYEYDDQTERWINYAQRIATETYSGIVGDKDIIVISFCNEAANIYHDNSLDSSISSPTPSFTSDYNNFITAVYNGYNSFAGIHYPIVFGSGSIGCGVGGGESPASKNFLLHSIAALKGTTMTVSEAENFSVQNPGFTNAEWTTLKTALTTTNPYNDDGLENYGWIGKWDRAAPTSGTVIITPEQFQEDINTLLDGITTVTTVTVAIQIPVTTVTTVAGTPTSNIISADNSWTMSYSLKDNSWVSWHSYRPNFYMHVAERHYAWVNGIDNIYKHGVENNYQTFFGTKYPHIVEFVSVSNPMTTKIWDNITFQTEAREYNASTDSYVDKRLITHNKLLIYNTRQCSGILDLIVKDEVIGIDYLLDQVQNTSDVTIDRNERDWNVNDFRDIRIDYDTPMFIEDIQSLQSVYYIDKIVNQATIDENKDWTQLESFRDKFLVVRFIFDNFDNIQLITNYSIESEQESPR